MAEPLLGEMIIFAGNFAPVGYAQCNGQIMPINQNQALFAILGTTYGGNGTTNFALPNMQGRVAVSLGNAPGLSGYVLGQQAGEESHALTQAEMPAHSHTVNAVNNSTTSGTNVPSTSTFLGAGYAVETNNPPESVYSTDAPTLASGPTGVGGGNQAHENRMPFLTTTWCIALVGVFPTRN